MSDSSPSIIRGGLATDERGTVRFVNDFNPKFYGVRRFYTIENHAVGYIRAWHGHLREAKWVYVASGAAIIGLVDLTTREATRYILSADEPRTLYIPPGYANGSCALKPNTVIFHFSNCSLGEFDNDDIRYAVDEFEDVWSVIPR